MVGIKHRNIGIDKNIYSWKDKDCKAENLGFASNSVSAKIINKIISINNNIDPNIHIMPSFVENNLHEWKNRCKYEFFVDFENFNGAISPIYDVLNSNTNNYLFMIGVGYYSSKWKYKVFVVNKLTFEEEERICLDFLEFIKSKSKNSKHARCVHWGNAENAIWREMLEKHNELCNKWKSWSWKWMDLLDVFKIEPIVIKGAFSFGLKEIATAMYKYGYIASTWNKDNDCIDGQNAMVAVHIANEKSSCLSETSEIIDLVNYNKIDVIVLYEIITYLRNHHIKSKRSRDDDDDDDDTGYINKKIKYD
jgi:hypothetical protein